MTSNKIYAACHHLELKQAPICTLITTLILEKLPQEVKLIVARKFKETWDLTKIFEIVNQQLGARKACTLKTAEDVKNYEGFPYTVLSLHISFQYRYQGLKFANIKYVFCVDDHWSDKCSLVTSPKARENSLMEKDFCFLCFYHLTWVITVRRRNPLLFKGMHNSTVCENKNKQRKSIIEKSDSLHIIFCLPVKNQLTKFAKTRFDYLENLQAADSGSTDELNLLIGSNFYLSVGIEKQRLGKWVNLWQWKINLVEF